MRLILFIRQLSPLVALAGCAPSERVLVRVVGESGALLPDATVELLGETYTPRPADGLVDLGVLDHPVLARIGAPDHLDEPVPLGRYAGGDTVEVRLLSDAGRIVLHAGGDVMLGRRYVTPTEGEPLLVRGDGGTSARAVVSELADAYGMADLSMVNLETVVGDFPDADAYPGKRWLLLTPPEGLDALDAVGTDVVGLGNNHQRDWMEAGVESTLENVDAAGFVRVGGGRDAEEAAAPATLSVGGMEVAVLSWTSVDGDYVNDFYPRDEEAAPADADWRWDAEEWGAPEYGVAVESRRIGSAWDVVDAAEADLDAEGRAALWASAVEVYPELQDWVARRGHGGANLWDTTLAPAAIAEARSAADLVVVQLHMGYQFSAVPGAGVRDAAHDAIDAGADLVVAHHPHVLQGLEWYKGKLIVWSLGNLIFDQDFLSTFRSAFLRTVWEEDGTLVQARLVPLFLDRYRPVPVTDALADGLFRSLWEAGRTDALADQGADLVIRSVAAARDADAAPVDMVYEWGTARIVEGSAEAEIDLDLVDGEPLAMGGTALVWRPLSEPSPAGVKVGRGLLGLGGFEDHDTDADVGEAAGWMWSAPEIAVAARAGVTGRACLEFILGPDSESAVSARTLARIPLPAHRLYADADGVTPLDGTASYTVRLRGWLLGEPGAASVRVALYHFDDTDPTTEPESSLLRTVVLHPELEQNVWTETLLELSAADLAPVGGLTPNAALLYLTLDVPTSTFRNTVWRVDDVELIEWRAADAEPPGWGAVDWLLGSGPVRVRTLGE